MEPTANPTAEFELQQLETAGITDDLGSASCSGCRGCSNIDS